MYRFDYCDGIVEAKCISIQFQRYRHTNHSEPVTIVKTIHFTPERSSLPVCLRLWLVAWWHHAITWTNVDLSSVRSSGIHLRAISQEIPQPLFTKVSLKIAYLKLNWNLPGANDLTYHLHNQFWLLFRLSDGDKRNYELPIIMIGMASDYSHKDNDLFPLQKRIENNVFFKISLMSYRS